MVKIHGYLTVAVVEIKLHTFNGITFIANARVLLRTANHRDRVTYGVLLFWYMFIGGHIFVCKVSSFYVK